MHDHPTRLSRIVLCDFFAAELMTLLMLIWMVHREGLLGRAKSKTQEEYQITQTNKKKTKEKVQEYGQ